jgi:hypothetical protein
MSLILRWIIITLAFVNAGYMAFDGGRALLVGDYLRPHAGSHAGQLGPWSGLVSKVGIDPESATMKIIFLCYGLIWLGVIIAYAMKFPWATNIMLLCAIGSLWYLGPGTALSSIIIVLWVLARFLWKQS